MDVMHERCAGLDVHKATIVACVRTVTGGKVNRECRTFDTTTAGLLALLAWLTKWAALTWRWRRREFTGSRYGTSSATATSN